MKCSISECGRPLEAKGFCNKHYQRWLRHGDPLGGGTSYGEPMKFYLDAVLPYRGRKCLIWPYARTPDGYGQIKIDGKMKSVHRLVCAEVYGPPTTPDHLAAHNCGLGHTGCCASTHVRWATHAENVADKIIHGTALRGERHPQVKLTEIDVQTIRQRRDLGASAEDLADIYGVTSRTIFQIGNRETWAWLPEKKGYENDSIGRR